MTIIKKIILIFITITTTNLTCMIHDYAKEKDRNYTSNSNIFRITPATILAPNKLRIQNNFFYFRSEHADTLFLVTEIEYAFSRIFSVQVTAPFLLQLNQNNETTRRGFGKLQLFTDIRWFLEEKFASIFRFGIELPTTSVRNSSSVGFNTTDVIMQLENILLTREWFIDFTLSSLITSKAKKNTRGILFGHQLDFARQFFFGNKPEINVLVGIIFNSYYGAKNRIFNIIDFNSGGFLLEMGPLFSISRDNILADLRIGFPIARNPFGIQNKQKFDVFTSFQVIF